MRELEISEVKCVSGAAWWSPSNIMDIINNVTHSTDESKPKPWTDYDGTQSDSRHIGKAIGVGVTIAASVIALAAIFSTASAGAFGISAVANRFK